MYINLILVGDLPLLGPLADTALCTEGK